MAFTPPAGGFVVSQYLNKGFVGSLSRDKDAIIHQRPVQTTDASAVPFGAPVALNPNNTVSLWGAVATTLTTATGTTATTSLDVAALTQSAPAGANVVLASGATTQTVTLAGAAAVGATVLAVESFVPTIAYPIGATVNVENTVAQLLGIALREVKPAQTYALNAPTTPLGSHYYPGDPCDVLERGTTIVVCQLGTATAGGAVYLRVALNGAYPNAVVGGFEAEADGANNVLVPNAKWTTGLVDANNATEVTILNRAAA